MSFMKFGHIFLFLAKFFGPNLAGPYLVSSQKFGHETKYANLIGHYMTTYFD